MKIEIDYTEKTIALKGKTNIDEFVETVKTLGIDTKEWSIKNDPEIQIVYPQHVHIEPLNPYYPFTGPTYITGGIDFGFGESRTVFENYES